MVASLNLSTCNWWMASLTPASELSNTTLTGSRFNGYGELSPLKREIPPLREDETGAIRVGNSRVLLEMVIRSFQDGASPESIVHRYSTLSLSDVYNTIGYYLRHQDAVEAYLSQREQLAESIQQRLSSVQPDLSFIRSRLLSQQNL